MKIYLSGAITADENYKIKFDYYEKHVQDMFRNAIIINPAKEIENAGMSDESYAKIMVQCLKLLSGCSHLFLIDDFKFSRGTKMEKMFAEAANIQIIYNSRGESERINAMSTLRLGEFCSC